MVFKKIIAAFELAAEKLTDFFNLGKKTLELSETSAKKLVHAAHLILEVFDAAEEEVEELLEEVEEIEEEVEEAVEEE